MAEKRSLQNDLSEAASSSDQKRPRPPVSTGAEAIAVNALQTFSSALEPLLRRVTLSHGPANMIGRSIAFWRNFKDFLEKPAFPMHVSFPTASETIAHINEELERALEKYTPFKVRQNNELESRNLQLKFKNKLSLPIFTGSKIEGDHGYPIQVVLVDASGGDIVSMGPESSMKIEIVVVEGDFEGNEEGDWTESDFDNHVVRERDGKRPLLAGDLLITLKEGIGTLGELSFTDNSSWIRSRKFRLGARVVADSCPGIQVKGALTEAFGVKDHRGELYKKHYPPLLHDDVWRLDKIGKDGAFHKRLNSEKIVTVQDFLRLLNVDSHRLRSVLGSGMSNKMWEGAVEHAKTCVLDSNLYCYYGNAQPKMGIVFNVVCELLGFISDEQYTLANELSEAQRVSANSMLKFAYENWNLVDEFDESSYISKDSCGFMSSACGETSEPQFQSQFTNITVHEQAVSPLLGDDGWMRYATDDLDAAIPGQVSMLAGFIQENMASEPLLSPEIPQNAINMLYDAQNLNAYSERAGLRTHYDGGTCFRDEHAEMGIRNYCSEQTAPEVDWKRFYCSKIGDQLDSDLSYHSFHNIDSQYQMQNMPYMMNTGENLQCQTFSSDAESCGAFVFSVFTGSGVSRRAYVFWLKLKAALKWAISIRKVAAAKRARLEELYD